MKHLWPRLRVEGEQPSLPFDVSSDTPDLRAAYASCTHLHRRFTFEQAMQCPAISIGLRNIAETLRRRRHEHGASAATGGLIASSAAEDSVCQGAS